MRRGARLHKTITSIFLHGFDWLGLRRRRSIDCRFNVSARHAFTWLSSGDPTPAGHPSGRAVALATLLASELCHQSAWSRSTAAQQPQGRLAARSDATFRSRERGHRTPNGVRKIEGTNQSPAPKTPAPSACPSPRARSPVSPPSRANTSAMMAGPMSASAISSKPWLTPARSMPRAEPSI